MAKEVNYAGSAALTGSTSAAHTTLIAILLTVLSPLQAMDTSLWIGIFLFASGIIRLGQVNRATPFQTLLLLFSGLTVARIPNQLLNGLETGLTIAGVTWTLAFACKGKPSRSLIITTGLLPFLRPELALLSLLLFGLQALRHWQDTKGDFRAFLRLVGLDAALLILTALPWLSLYAANTGIPYPMTMGAKRAYFTEAFFSLDYKLLRFTNTLGNFFEVVGMLTVGLFILPFSRLGRVGIIFLFGFLAAYWINFPGALSHYEGRYLYVALFPFLLLGIAQMAGSRKKKIQIAATIVLLIAAEQPVLFFPGIGLAISLAGNRLPANWQR